MKTIYLVVFLCVCSFTSYAQQDLEDPRYIYSLDDDDQQTKSIMHTHSFYASLRKPDYSRSVLFEGKLYKHVDFLTFFFDNDLKNYRGKHYNKPRKISKYTDDPSVKALYVVGEIYSDKKIEKIRAWHKSLSAKK